MHKSNLLHTTKHTKSKIYTKQNTHKSEHMQQRTHAKQNAHVKWQSYLTNTICSVSGLFGESYWHTSCCVHKSNSVARFACNHLNNLACCHCSIKCHTPAHILQYSMSGPILFFHAKGQQAAWPSRVRQAGRAHIYIKRNFRNVYVYCCSCWCCYVPLFS